jgi:hypothetical protein
MCYLCVNKTKTGKEKQDQREPNVQAEIKLRSDSSHIEYAVRTAFEVEVPEVDWRKGDDCPIVAVIGGGGGR